MVLTPDGCRVPRVRAASGIGETSITSPGPEPETPGDRNRDPPGHRNRTFAYTLTPAGCLQPWVALGFPLCGPKAARARAFMSCSETTRYSVYTSYTAYIDGAAQSPDCRGRRLRG